MQGGGCEHTKCLCIRQSGKGVHMVKGHARPSSGLVLGEQGSVGDPFPSNGAATQPCLPMEGRQAHTMNPYSVLLYIQWLEASLMRCWELGKHASRQRKAIIHWWAAIRI